MERKTFMDPDTEGHDKGHPNISHRSPSPPRLAPLPLDRLASLPNGTIYNFIAGIRGVAGIRFLGAGVFN